MIVLGFCSCQKEKPDTADTAASPAVVDVYVSGAEYNGSVGIATYWKNGQVVSLTDGTKNAWAASIAVVGSDVYVAGSESNGSVEVAKYWKNGQAVALTDGTQRAVANSIVVVGSNVYVAGVEVNGGFSVAKYWKNGQAVALTDGTKPSRGKFHCRCGQRCICGRGRIQWACWSSQILEKRAGYSTHRWYKRCLCIFHSRCGQRCICGGQEFNGSA